jgi:hypothetical protein
MPSLDTPDTPGLLSLKPQTGGPGPRNFNIEDGQQWLHAIAQAAGSHSVTRWLGEGSPVEVTTEGGSTFSITPAGSEDEFEAQRAALEFGFRRAVGRPPAYEGGTADDDVFWETLAAIYDAYEGPTLDPTAFTGGIS